MCGLWVSGWGGGTAHGKDPALVGAEHPKGHPGAGGGAAGREDTRRCQPRVYSCSSWSCG